MKTLWNNNTIKMVKSIKTYKGKKKSRSKTLELAELKAIK